MRTRRAPLSLAVSLFLGVALLAACGDRSRLTREEAVRLIKDAPSFKAPIDPGVVFVDATYRPGPNTRREFLNLEGLVLKKDGPYGIAGSTAAGAFTWRWNEGPFANRVFRSKVRLNNSGSGWKVYDDELKKQLYAAERGED